jgi:hypothetical protein
MPSELRPQPPSQPKKSHRPPKLEILTRFARCRVTVSTVPPAFFTSFGDVIFNEVLISIALLVLNDADGVSES